MTCEWVDAIRDFRVAGTIELRADVLFEWLLFVSARAAGAGGRVASICEPG